MSQRMFLRLLPGRLRPRRPDAASLGATAAAAAAPDASEAAGAAASQVTYAPPATATGAADPSGIGASAIAAAPTTASGQVRALAAASMTAVNSTVSANTTAATRASASVTASTATVATATTTLRKHLPTTTAAAHASMAASAAVSAATGVQTRAPNAAAHTVTVAATAALTAGPPVFAASAAPHPATNAVSSTLLETSELSASAPASAAHAAAAAASAALVRAIEAPWPQGELPYIPKGRSVVVDFETTGLPRVVRGGKRRPYDPNLYDTARAVSLGWQVLGPPPAFELMSKGYTVIRPDGFTIPADATDVHGITTEAARQQGVPVGQALDALLADLQGCEAIVAHNVAFDLGVLLSELFRLQRHDDLAALGSLRPVCTARVAVAALSLRRLPRLGTLLSQLTGRSLVNAHHAGSDVEACADCYRELLQRQLRS